MQTIEKSKTMLNQTEYREMAKIFKALSDETRLRIMHFLLENGRHCVMEIAEALSISQTASSRNLKMLRERGFLRDERINPCIYYDVVPEHIELIEFLTKKLKEKE
ncbi:MAG: ArsR/SmtB family transcription factor [Candidatus Zixiibacteriota bacterium]